MGLLIFPFSLYTQPLELPIYDAGIDSLNHSAKPLHNFIAYLADGKGEIGDSLPLPSMFAKRFDLDSALKSNKNTHIWAYGRLGNGTNEKIELVLYYEIDKIQIHLHSQNKHTIDTVFSGGKELLTQINQTKSPYQSSHIARSSSWITLEARDTLEIFMLCGPFLQKKEKPFFSLSTQKFYQSEYAPKLSAQLNLFWILEGMFAFMVIFSFFMYVINKDQAYLYYSLYALALAEYLILTVPTDAFLNFGNYPRLQGIFFNIMAYAIPAMYGLFTLAYVHNDGYEPQLKSIILWTTIGTGIGCLISSIYLLFSPINAFWYQFTFWMNLPFASSFGIMAVYALYIYLRSDLLLVRYFGFASLFVVGGGLLILGGNYLLGSLGNISNFSNMSMLLAFEICGAIQLLSFALCLSYRGRLIEQEKNQLKTVDQAKSHFFANVSHEFRTPLTLILGPVKDLIQTENDPSRKKQLSLIQRNGRKLLRFITQILDLAKLEEGQMELEARNGDLLTFVQRLTGAFESVAASRKVDLRFHCTEASLMCQFDQDKLEKVLNNLLSNACKFIQEGGNIAVDLSLERKELIRISVSDDGPGISPIHQPYIFDRFYQAPSNDFTTHQPSTGIGLALTKELVELHGGSIKLQSQLGQGSKFIIQLPFVSMYEGADGIDA
ncbi:MAG: sensor histidine kinase, partial [Bacteroidota bacterium]